MRPTLGSVASDGVFRGTRSFDGVGAMARTPLDLSHLVETIFTASARAKLPVDGFAGALKGKWEGLRVGIAESTWESGDKDKWLVPRVVRSSLSLLWRILNML
jgi:Asp-tRNA(Asn)/Glu-tRNA(Gln) amidotransferase A subunit family amidase